MLILAPLAGAAYVVYLPCIGFAMVASFLAKKIGSSLSAGVTHLAMILSPEWRPGEAYFLGRRKKSEPKSAKANEAKTENKK
jgi:hypothetical protein